MGQVTVYVADYYFGMDLFVVKWQKVIFFFHNKLTKLFVFCFKVPEISEGYSCLNKFECDSTKSLICDSITKTCV